MKSISDDAMIKEAIPLLYTVMVLRRVIKDPVSKLVPLMIPLIYDTICGSYMNLNRITIIASNLRIFQLFSLAFSGGCSATYSRHACKKCDEYGVKSLIQKRNPQQIFLPRLFYFSKGKREGIRRKSLFFLNIPLAILPRRIVLISPLFSAILYPSSWTGVLTWCFPRQVLSSTFRTVLAGRRAIPRLTD